ncbi:cupin domain-containing protein [Streptomyces lasalocidi]|uniref:Cupin domain-containing protein n=1 Tax=Streptomyces lasalocidi TaxID=324833 RepID=A0A4U5WAT0_STRLS|nr:cupin domain-containing protein [Streptomyces lasalocidi]
MRRARRCPSGTATCARPGSREGAPPPCPPRTPTAWTASSGASRAPPTPRLPLEPTGVAPGRGPRPVVHAEGRTSRTAERAHERHEEAFRVLEGELSLDVDDRTLTLGAGAYAVVPRGAVHRPYNAGPVQVRVPVHHLAGAGRLLRRDGRAERGHRRASLAQALRDLGARWDCVFTALPGGGATTRMVNEDR